MDQANCPPVAHTLKPHHIGILSFLIAYHRGLDWGDKTKPSRALSKSVKQRMLVLLAHEIAEMAPPTPYGEMIAKLAPPPDEPHLEPEFAWLQFALTALTNTLSAPEILSNFMSDLRRTVSPAGEETVSDETVYVFERRSFFGLFVRRCVLSYRKLAFAGQMRLLQDYKAWLAGHDRSGYQIDTPERRKGLQMYPVIIDLLELAKHEYYTSAVQASKSGDRNVAFDNLRRFYDQRFAMSDDSLLYQHALLDMAKMHYAQGELNASRLFLDEAIKVSREKNDPQTLDSCRSLLQRLAPDPATLYIAHDRRATLKPGESPLEVLFEVKRLLELGEGIFTCFVKVYESMGVWDTRLRSNLGVEKWPRHIVMAILWRLAGVETLAKVHERIILTFVPVGDDDARITALCLQASSLTRQGQHDEALALLIDPQTWRGLNFRQYHVWAREVWKTFDFVAERRGQDYLRRSYLLAKQPPAPAITQVLDGAESIVNRRTVLTERLREAFKTRMAGASIQAVRPLMEVLWSAEVRGMYGYYRIAVVLLADISIDLHLSHTCLSWLEEILPQVLLGDDLELRAYASMTYARCLIASMEGTINEAKLKETRPHLIRAVKDYRAISLNTKAMEALSILAIVCHNLNSFAERDSWSEQFAVVSAEDEAFNAVHVDEDTAGCFAVISEAGNLIGRDY